MNVKYYVIELADITNNYCGGSILAPVGGGGGTWVYVCWVCAAGLSDPLPHCSLFFGQL